MSDCKVQESTRLRETGSSPFAYWYLKLGEVEGQSECKSKVGLRFGMMLHRMQKPNMGFYMPLYKSSLHK